MLNSLLEKFYFHLDPNYYFSEKAENFEFFENLEFSQTNKFTKICLVTIFLICENIKYKITEISKLL